MAQGCEVRDASGNVIFTTSTRFGVILGVFDIPAGGTSGSQTNAGLANGTPFWFCRFMETAYGADPVISVSGTTLSWTYNGFVNCRVIYGVY